MSTIKRTIIEPCIPNPIEVPVRITDLEGKKPRRDERQTDEQRASNYQFGSIVHTVLL